jgi:hypothetical protein
MPTVQTPVRTKEVDEKMSKSFLFILNMHNLMQAHFEALSALH